MAHNMAGAAARMVSLIDGAWGSLKESARERDANASGQHLRALRDYLNCVHFSNDQ